VLMGGAMFALLTKLLLKLKDSVTQIPDQTVAPRGWVARSLWARNLPTF